MQHMLEIVGKDGVSAAVCEAVREQRDRCTRRNGEKAKACPSQ
jgi:hypothetical protein